MRSSSLLLWLLVWTWQPPRPATNVQVNARLQGCACTMNAGPSTHLNQPVVETTLYGHLTGESVSAVSLTWAQLSGPGTAAIAAPWDLITSVSFAGQPTGVYTFQLSAADTTGTSTSTATVTYNSTSGWQQIFYVDPNYTGSATHNGAPATPWNSLCDTDSDNATKWGTIRTALASGDVLIVFPPRVAASDTMATAASGCNLRVQRLCLVKIVDTHSPANSSDVDQTFPWCATTDPTPAANQLVVDGMSFYDSTPASASATWVSYSGTNKFGISNCSGTCIGWDDHLYRNNVRIRGFDTSGNIGRIVVSGNDIVVEHVKIHDMTGGDGGGPAILSDNTTTDWDSADTAHACVGFGNKARLTFRDITSIKTDGEGVYVGGTYAFESAGGCPTPTYTPAIQNDFLVDGATIDFPGFDAAEGDCVDVKGGWEGGVIRKVHCTNPVNSCEGLINFQGCFFGDTCQIVVEQNDLSPGADVPARDGLCNGPVGPGNLPLSDNVYGGITFGGPFKGFVIRNNVIHGSTVTACGICIDGQNNAITNTPWAQQDVRVENNTISGGQGVGVRIFGSLDNFMVQNGTVINVKLRNNALVSNGSGNQIHNAGNLAPPNPDSDYNLLVPAGSDFTEGGHSIIRASNSGIFVTLGTDFHLVSGSPAILAAVNLSQIANHPTPPSIWNLAFTTDFASTLRQAAGTLWDIGAYKF